MNKVFLIKIEKYQDIFHHHHFRGVGVELRIKPNGGPPPEHILNSYDY
jgi:hypothetical protein